MSFLKPHYFLLQGILFILTLRNNIISDIVMCQNFSKVSSHLTKSLIVLSCMEHFYAFFITLFYFHAYWPPICTFFFLSSHQPTSQTIRKLFRLLSVKSSLTYKLYVWNLYFCFSLALIISKYVCCAKHLRSAAMVFHNLKAAILSRSTFEFRSEKLLISEARDDFFNAKFNSFHEKQFCNV